MAQLNLKEYTLYSCACFFKTTETEELEASDVSEKPVRL